MPYNKTTMTNKKISFRPKDQEKHALIFSIVSNTLDEFKKFNDAKENPPFDSATIEAIRRQLTILEGWETIYLNNAFRMGMCIGSSRHRPDGLYDKDVYSYVEDFFKTKDESK